MKPVKTGIIILAAGNSSRLGQPKQLLKYEGKTLVRRAVESSLESNSDGCVLVLGHNSELIKSEVQDIPIEVIINKDWEKGMSSGMQKGLQLLEKKIMPDQVILMLCDQPYVNSILLRAMIQKQSETDKGIIACQYKGTFGVPALFTRKYFPQLIKLTGSEGAKKIIYAHLVDMEKIDFPNGAIDIDTWEDYDRLTKKD